MNRLETEAKPYLAGGAYFPDSGTVRIAVGAVTDTGFADAFKYVESFTRDRFGSLRLCFAYLLGHELAHFHQHLGGYYPEIFGSSLPRYHRDLSMDYKAGKHVFARIAPESYFAQVVQFALIHFGWLQENYYPQLEIVDDPFSINTPGSFTPVDPQYNHQLHEVGAQITGNQLSVAYAHAFGLPQLTFGYHRFANNNSEWVKDEDLPIEHRRKADPSQVGK